MTPPWRVSARAVRLPQRPHRSSASVAGRNQHQRADFFTVVSPHRHTMPNDSSFIQTPPGDIAGWLTALEARDIPVFEATMQAIADASAVEDVTDAHGLADLLTDDPLMTLKLLRHVGELRRGRQGSDVETVTAALVMIGIPPFFRAFGHQFSVQTRLQHSSEALQGLLAVRRRAHRAARFSLGFAVHRMDHDAAVLHEAALLHDFVEMLLWVHAPALALEIARRQRHEPQLRSQQVQRELLNVSLAELEQALMKRWRLPELLVSSTSDEVSPSPQVRNVQLAVRVSRHSALGWDNPALPDDVDAVAALLNLRTTAALQLLQALDHTDTDIG